MSGGAFNYLQFQVEDIADEINEVIRDNDSTEKDNFGGEVGHHYPPEVIEKLKEAADTICKAAKMAHRVDWLLSDDGEESFLRRWKEDIEE